MSCAVCHASQWKALQSVLGLGGHYRVYRCLSCKAWHSQIVVDRGRQTAIIGSQDK